TIHRKGAKTEGTQRSQPARAATASTSSTPPISTRTREQCETKGTQRPINLPITIRGKTCNLTFRGTNLQVQPTSTHQHINTFYTLAFLFLQRKYVHT